MKKTIFLLMVIAVLFSCNKKSEYIFTLDDINIIPKPSGIQLSEGFFVINNSSKLIVENENATSVAKYLSEFLSKSGVDIDYSVGDAPIENSIFFSLVDMPELGTEGYKLDVNYTRIKISANTTTGLFYAIQTLRQILPVSVEANDKRLKTLVVPNILITDNPRFIWRGMLLDCCRHFMDKEFVKRYIDLLAYHKMNVLHWHLTEDQGWRIEIDKYPKLTEISAWRTGNDGTKYGGFYTKEDIKEVVEYAKSRHVTVVPEIEFPGHSKAALAAYPHLSCTGGPFEVETNWGVFKDIYCAGNDSAFLFLEDVLTEVIELFPSEYIHIGGDEAPKDRWEQCPKCQERIKKEGLKDEHELQSYFITRMEKFLNARGKKLIGWDEILEGGLAPSATVQSWRGMEGAIEAAKSGHDAIVSPASHTYFDHSIETVTLQKVYSFEPIPGQLTEEESKHILGGECNMWTERAPQETIDGKMFPRILAMSEVLWSDTAGRKYSEFHKRVQVHYKRLDNLEVDYGYETLPVSFEIDYNKTNREYTVSLFMGQDNMKIYYTLDGTDPNIESNEYQKPFMVNETATIRAIAFNNDKPFGEIAERKVVIHKALDKTIKFENKYSLTYKGNGDLSLTDGFKGTEDFRDGIWQGYHQDDLNVIIDLGNITEVKHISIGFLQSVSSWIFLPTEVEFYFSEDGKNFTLAGSKKCIATKKASDDIVEDFSLDFNPEKARYVKVIGKNIKNCPEWHLGAGGKTWLFADEIVVE